MSPLVFRTAIPFGYLLFFAFLLGVAVLGVAVLGVALAGAGDGARRPRTAAAGVAVAGLAAYAGWVNYAAERDLDANLVITAPAQLAGSWAGAGRTALDLRADGGYQCAGAACAGLGAGGTWARAEDFDVVLWPAGAPRGTRYRVVAYRGALHLASPMLGDPDEWDTRFFLERIAPAAERGAAAGGQSAVAATPQRL